MPNNKKPPEPKKGGKDDKNEKNDVKKPEKSEKDDAKKTSEPSEKNEKNEKGEQNGSSEEGKEGKDGKDGKKKLSRAERKKLLKKQEELEKKLVEEGKIPPRDRYIPRGIFWRIFSVCVAFFFGIFAAVGGILGGLLAVGTTTSTRKSLSLFGIEAEKFLKDDYLDMSVLDVYRSVIADLNNLADPKEITLDTFAKYTPVIDNYIELLDTYTTEFGIDVNWDEVRTLRFDALGSYAKNSILPKLELGPLLQLDKDVTLEKINSNAMMYAIAYGSVMKDYTISDGKIVMAEGKTPHTITDLAPTLLGSSSEGKSTMDFVGSIELGSLLGLDIRLPSEEGQDNAMFYALCYGSEGTDYTFGDDGVLRMAEGKEAVKVSTLLNDVNAHLNTLPLGTILGLEQESKLSSRSENALMYTLCYGTEGVDYKVEGNKLIHLEGGKDPTTVGELTTSSNTVVNALPLGEMLGLNTSSKLSTRSENALMYTLCYGTEGVDYKVEGNELIHLEGGKEPVTVGDLTTSSNNVVNDLPLGEMLGLNTADKIANHSSNAVMYALCYGTEGVDYDIVENKIVMRDGHSEKKVRDLTEHSSDLINSIEVETILGVKPDSDAVVRYVAYGAELPKEDGEYVKNEDGSYKTEQDPSAEEGTLRYAGGGRYVIEVTDGVKSIKMLPDPNDPSKTYGKKTVAELTAADADLLEGMTIGSIVEIDSSSSSLMQKLKDWTIEDLKNQDKIESLQLGELMTIDDTSSGVMQSMKEWTLKDLKDQNKIEELKLGDILKITPTEEGGQPDDVSNILWALRDKSVGELKQQETIDNLLLSDVLDITDSSSGLMKAMKDWKISELQNQGKIEGLKIGEIVNLGANPSGIMKAISTWTIGDLNKQTRIERLKIGQIVDLGDSPSGIMNAMQDWRISDLNSQEKINSLTLGDVITIDAESPHMLQSLKTMTLGEISTGIDTLTLEDVLGADVFEDNRILDRLRYVQVRGLGDAIKGLHAEDLFGDEIWSYAKKSTYQEGERVKDKVKGDVVTKYFHEDSELTAGWYKKVGEGYVKVEDTDVKNNSYVEEKVTVTREVSYLVVDYDKSSSAWQPFEGSPEDVQHDDFSDYYMEGEIRHDLEPVFTYKKGEEVVDGKRIYEEGDTFYYLEQTPVERRYAAADETTYGEEEIEEKYFSGEEELTRYHAGVWFLLFDGAPQGAQTPITETGELITGITAKINELTLKEMYVRELINEDPSVNISKLTATSPTLSAYKNLNELTVNQVITLVNYIATGGILGA